MKSKLKAIFVASTFILASNLVVHAQETENPAMPQPEVEKLKKAETKTFAPDEIIAVIDGKKLTVKELDEWTKIISDGPAETLAQRRMQALQAFVSIKAFADAAIKDKIDQDPDFQKRQILTRENNLRQAYITKTLTDSVSEADLKAYYDEKIATMPKETEVHARHILVDTEEEAKNIIERLDAGESFEKIAKEASLDSSSEDSGDLGYFGKGQMVKPFEDAAFSLKVGEYTKTPVQSQFGWHIIKVEDIRAKPQQSFDEARLQIENALMQRIFAKLVKKILDEFPVSYPDKDVDQYMKDATANTGDEAE